MPKPKHLSAIVRKLAFPFLIGVGAVEIVATCYFALGHAQLIRETAVRETQLVGRLASQSALLSSSSARIRSLESEDQRVRNDKIEVEVSHMKGLTKKALGAYEGMLRVRDAGAKITDLESIFAKVLGHLWQFEYASASAAIDSLESETGKLASSIQTQTTVNAPLDNTPPGSGFKQQAVEVNGARFTVSIIAADLNSTRVVVETASEGDCADNCPVGSLASYVARAGGYAGINGPYFCPASYPSCAGKANSFDTLLMNRNKAYFNSANNVYSSVPAAIFTAGGARFVGASSEWGRDTSVDSVIAGQPLLLLNGEIRFGGDDEVKRASRGARSFIGSKGSTVYIGVVFNANVAEVALVLHAMGLEHALNLDSGGSTALYSGGRYVVGPGRDTPFGIVFAPR